MSSPFNNKCFCRCYWSALRVGYKIQVNKSSKCITFSSTIIYSILLKAIVALLMRDKQRDIHKYSHNLVLCAVQFSMSFSKPVSKGLYLRVNMPFSEEIRLCFILESSNKTYLCGQAGNKE